MLFYVFIPTSLLFICIVVQRDLSPVLIIVSHNLLLVCIGVTCLLLICIGVTCLLLVPVHVGCAGLLLFHIVVVIFALMLSHTFLLSVFACLIINGSFDAGIGLIHGGFLAIGQVALA